MATEEEKNEIDEVGEEVIPNETSPQENPKEETAPVEAPPEATPPEGASPEEAPPAEAPTEGAPPEAAAPEGAAPEGAEPEAPASEGAPPEGAAPEGAAPEGAAPEGASPEGASPEEAPPEDTPAEVPAEGGTAPEEAPEEEPSPGETSAEAGAPAEEDKKDVEPEEGGTAEAPPEKLETPDTKQVKGFIDDDTLKKLEEIEKEAKEAANTIYEIKVNMQELATKSQMTEKEAKALEEDAKKLKEKMKFFEEKTKQIQEILTNAKLLGTRTRVPQVPHEEDVLPRVVLCGYEDCFPKIVVFEQKILKGKKKECVPGCPGVALPSDTEETRSQTPETSTKNLEEIKLRLEADLAYKDRILDDLQMRLSTLQTEIREVSMENSVLSEKIRNMQKQHEEQMDRQTKQIVDNRKRACTADAAAKLQKYTKYSQQLERQLAIMEKDFDEVHKEIIDSLKGVTSCKRR